MSELCLFLHGKDVSVQWCSTHDQPVVLCQIAELKEENERLRADLSLAATLCFHGDKSSVVEVLKQYHNCQSSTSAEPKVGQDRDTLADRRNGYQSVMKAVGPVPEPAGTSAEAGDSPKSLTELIAGNMSCPWSEPKYEHHTMRIDKCTVCGKPLAVKSMVVFLARGGETPGPKRKAEGGG